MSQGRHATPVKLAKKEREELLWLIERKTAAQRDVMRDASRCGRTKDTQIR
jgi:hypothetical protein